MNDIDLLFAAARRVHERAYAPYSRYGVGVAIRDDAGQLHVGVNVENAAYPIGTCAEAGAIAAMIASGGRWIAEMCVVGDGELLVTPCGGCRQRIREFASPSTLIHCASLSGVQRSFTLEELLPYSFGPNHLVELK